MSVPHPAPVKADPMALCEWLLDEIVGQPPARVRVDKLIAQAKLELETIGFQCKLTEETYRNIVEAGFNRATLPQVFVLAQVLLDHQPISLQIGRAHV